MIIWNISLLVYRMKTICIFVKIFEKNILQTGTHCTKVGCKGVHLGVIRNSSDLLIRVGNPLLLELLGFRR